MNMLWHVMLFQANLKADATTKPLLQRCQDLVKIIDEYPAKVFIPGFILFAVKTVGRISAGRFAWTPTWEIAAKIFSDREIQ